MSVFHFKRFDVVNDRSAMKVNTDGVLLGALMTVPGSGESAAHVSRLWPGACDGGASSDEMDTPAADPGCPRILDIGTGTGTIALMAAQRCPEAVVEAIDIDEASALEAAQNFAASPWADRMNAHRMSLDAYAARQTTGIFDLICSNPPYFDNSLTNPDGRRSDARHTGSLSYREIIAFATGALAPEGVLALVLPSEEEARVCREARSRGLFLSRIVRIRTTPRKAPRRIVVEFMRRRAAACPVSSPSSSARSAAPELLLTIQDGASYTPEYLALMRDFYLFA